VSTLAVVVVNSAFIVQQPLEEMTKNAHLQVPHHIDCCKKSKRMMSFEIINLKNNSHRAKNIFLRCLLSPDQQLYILALFKITQTNKHSRISASAGGLNEKNDTHAHAAKLAAFN
jgi:hypothetical protein